MNVACPFRQIWLRGCEGKCLFITLDKKIETKPSFSCQSPSQRVVIPKLLQLVRQLYIYKPVGNQCWE